MALVIKKKYILLYRGCTDLVVVRRIGMIKPPVKLGVGKKFLEKRKEPPSGKMKLVWQP